MMSTAEQWASVLGGRSAEQFTLRFERLGLDARCRALSAGEVEECVRMGGERGLRYALYLACDDLREAGESMKKQGAVASAFDITEQLSYGDVLAAGAAILSRSGAQQPQVRMDDEAVPLPAAMPLSGGGQEERLTLPVAQSVYPSEPQGWADADVMERNGWISAGQVARDFADRLWAASGNR